MTHPNRLAFIVTAMRSPPMSKAQWEIAFERVRSNLDKDGGWLSNGKTLLKLEAEDVYAAPFHKLLRPDNRGHTFYEQD